MSASLREAAGTTASARPMAQIDDASLIHLAHERTAHGRAALAINMVELFSDKADRLTDRERSMMCDILRQLVGTVERTVRRALALKLADVASAPRDLITYLANDHADVAFPILTRSLVLADEDLIEIVRHRALEHQLAIAMREGLSEAVSEVLAETGTADVITTLLHNRSARISHRTLSYLVEESRRVDQYREPLLRREELGRDLAKRMFLWVSAALRQYIIERYALDTTTLEKLLQEVARENSGDQLKGPAADGVKNLAKELAADVAVEPELLVQALVSGEINLFIGMFAQSTGIRRRLVRRIVFEQQASGLAIACKASGLDRDTFRRIYTLIRSSHPQNAAATPPDTEKALALYDRLPLDQAKRVVARWRLDPDFAGAIRDVEVGRQYHG